MLIAGLFRFSFIAVSTLEVSKTHVKESGGAFIPAGVSARRRLVSVSRVTATCLTRIIVWVHALGS